MEYAVIIIERLFVRSVKIIDPDRRIGTNINRIKFVLKLKNKKKQVVTR